MADSSGSVVTSSTEWSIFADAAGPTEQTGAIECEVWIGFLPSEVGTIVVRQYEKITATSAQREHEREVYLDHVQGSLKLPLHLLRHGYDVTIEAIDGTPEVEWSIRTPGP